MNVKYFDETGTLRRQFRDNGIAESKNLDENNTLDVDSKENVCAIAFERASQLTEVRHVALEGIAA